MDRPVVFLDRDNTIIYDPGYLSEPEQVRLLDGAVDGLQLLQRAGYRFVLISNQSGVGRGYFQSDSVARVQERLDTLLAAHSIAFEGIFYCFHNPAQHCRCRKPEPGLLLAAADLLQISLTDAWMIGDKPADCAAGRRAGCRTILVETGRTDERVFTAPEQHPDAIFPTLHEAAMHILQQDGRSL